MNKLFFIALAAIVATSCQNSESSETAETVTTDSITMGMPAPVAPATGDQGVPTNTVTVPAGSNVATAPATGGTQAGATGLNPEHGKPGHRCDISVGAPLNSPPGNIPTPGVTSTPTQAPVATPVAAPAANPQPFGSTGKLNPAHGEPGHDCKVPVGQPLK